MAQMNAHVKVSDREIQDPWHKLCVRQSLGEPMLVEAQFVAASPPSDPRQYFTEVLGKPLTLVLQRNEDSAKFDSLVTSASVHSEGYGLVGRGPLYGLTVAKRSRGFIDQSPKQVLERVLDTAGVSGEVLANIPLASNPLPYIAQHQETDFDFVHRLAGWVGLVVYEHGGKVIVAEAPQGPSVRLKATEVETARIVLEPITVASKAAAMDYSPHAEARATVSTIGSISDSQYRSTLDSPSNALFTGPPATLSDGYPKTSNGLTDQLRARARHLVGRSIRYEFTTYRPDVQVGVVVDVPGHVLITERLFVIEVFIDRGPGSARRAADSAIEGDYASRVIAVPEKMVGPVRLPSMPTVGMLGAIVAENNDPHGLGRVQVKFPWDEQPTAWARVASFSAGASHGAFWVPEIGDEVLVHFEFGDPSRPVVVGSLYHSEATPLTETEHGAGDVLLTHTRAGTEIRVVQTKGGEEIRLRLGDGGPEVRMLAADPPNVAITVDGGKCIVKAKTIELTAEERVTMHGGEVSLNSDGEMKIAAAGTVTINGSQIKLN